MDFKLVFTKSGDSIQLVHHNADLVNYYIESLNSTNKNKFKLSNNDFINHINNLKSCIIDINNFFQSKFKISIFHEFVSMEVYNQHVLNKIHREWVKFQLEYQRMNNLLMKVDANLLKKFRDINDILHDIEGIAFKIVNFDRDNIWGVKNIFGTDILDYNKYNVRIEFHDLGRSTYDKWKFHDTNLDNFDTSDFEILSGELILTTTKPFTMGPPKAYKTWCKNNNMPIIGHTLGLGNFLDPIEVVTEILYKNLKTGCTNLKLIV